MRRRPSGVLLVLPLLLAGCGGGSAESERPEDDAAVADRSWVYQLTDYPDGSLDEIAAAPHDVAVIDLARDGGSGYFTAAEIGQVQASGKQVFGYFSMGSIETYRPEYDAVAATELILNQWGDWPDEYFVKYWEPQWWELAVAPRLDAALAAGFDGVYLDVPNAYEEIELSLVPQEDRDSLAEKMVDQIIQISQYAKAVDEEFMILPQNSPELREYNGYLAAIDGLGVEDLFFLDADIPCTEEWCGENLANVAAIRDAGKLILAVDYAGRQDNVDAACARYAQEGFTGYVTTVELDRIAPPCP